MGCSYREYSEFLSEMFDGKVQKLSVDTACSCPNRDGTVGTGGCIYCNNSAFSPDGDKRGLPIKIQIARGREFFARKYPSMRYLAYFQSNTSTHASADAIMAQFEEALAEEDVVGLVIGTRPDCFPAALAGRLQSLSQETGKRIIIEFGVESSHDATLKRINRGHDWACACEAIQRAADAGFPVGVHLIMGLPEETEEMMAETVRRINALPVSTIKFHQLQLLRGTLLASMYSKGECKDITLFEPEAYADLCCRLLSILRSDIAVDRFVASAPKELLLAPCWGLKNYQFTELIRRRLR